MPLRLAAAAASLLARTEKPMIAALKPSASVTSDSEMPPTPACRMRAATSSVPSFSSEPRIASSEPCTSALTISGNAGSRVLALLVGAIARDLAGAGFVLDHGEAVAGLRRTVEAEHFHRNRGACLLDSFALVRNQRAHAPHLGAGHDDVADTQRAALHQHGRDRAASAVQFRLDHGAFGRTV